METHQIIIVTSVLAAVAVIYLIFYFKDKKLARQGTVVQKEDNKVSAQLKLQAYERLVLLADRISLPSLIGRLNMNGLSSREMQGVLIHTIKQEFEHNITQQIYVSNEAWEAIRNLKEQNILIINQVSSFLPETATGVDLNKALADLLAQNPQASLHGIVAEALSYEAKKVLA